MKDVGFLNTNEVGVNEVAFAVTGVAQGAKALLQQVMILMFVSPQDPCRYMGGGFIRDFKSSNITSDNVEQVRNLLTIAVNEVKTTVKAIQDVNTSLTDDERLSDITISTLEMPDDTSLKIALDVITKSGATASAVIPSTGGL